jgi:hypothetical protein
MNTETSKLMQEALQAAVARINSGSPEAQTGPADTIGAVLSVLPKLLRGNEPSEDMLEKLDALERDGLTPLRGDMLVLRKQLSRVVKSQEQLVTKVDEMQKQQSLVAQAVLDLARQMARITLIEDAPTGDDDDAREAPPVRESYRRADSRANGDGRRTSQRET